MLWTQILYLIMVSVNLLQGWNISDVTLPCEGCVQPISSGQPAWGGFPLSSLGGPHSSVVSVQSLGWLCLSQSQLTGRWIFSLQSGSQPVACTLESASQSLADGPGCSTEEFWSCCWSDQMTRYRAWYNLINRCTFPQQKQGILAQQTPSFFSPAWRLLFWGTCSLLLGLKHYLVTHPSWNILYSTAKHVQAARSLCC